jgi:hypothetical protein
MTEKEMLAEIDRLKKANESLQAAQTKLSLKISTKKALSLYGMGRWPVTLYKSQWLRLIDATEDIKAFIKAHDGELLNISDKATAPTATAPTAQ